MKAESQIKFVYVPDLDESVLVEEAKCPKCRLWMEITPRQAIGKSKIQCKTCSWTGYVGREELIT